MDACVFVTLKMTCADQGPRRHPPIDSVQPEVGEAVSRSSAEAEKAPPDCFATSRRPHAPARSTESGLPSCLNTPRPRCTSKSPPLGTPASTVLCTSRSLHLYSKLHLHPAPESRYSPHVVSKRVAALQPLQAPVHPAPRAHRPQSQQSASPAWKACDKHVRQRLRQPTQEPDPAKRSTEERPDRVLASTHGARSLPRAPTM